MAMLFISEVGDLAKKQHALKLVKGFKNSP